MKKTATQPQNQSEARYKAILDAIPDLMFCLSRDGVYLDFKGDALEATVPKEAIIGKNLWDLLPPDVAQMCLDTICKTLDSETLQTLEYQLPTPLGMRDYEARLVVSGKDEVLSIVRDITERKQAEVALRESEEKFSKAFRSCPDSITISTLQEGHYIDVNESFLSLAGYDRDQVIGHTVSDISLWINLQNRASVVQMLQKEGMVRNLEVEWQRKDGTVVVVLLSAEIIELGGEQCMLCVGNDITERQRAEMELQTSAVRVSEASQRARLLAEIALRIRRSLNLEQILNTTVKEVRQFLQCDRVFISRVNKNLYGEIFAESVGENWEPVVGLFVADKAYVRQLGNIFAQTCVMTLDDVESAEISPLRAEYFTKYHVKAALAVPIMQGEEIVGALVAHQCSSQRHWQLMEIELLKQLATQVAIAIQQAELYQQVQALNANLEHQVEERTQQLEQRNQELLELNQLKDVFLHAVTHDLRTPVLGWLLVLKNVLTNSCETVAVSRSILERMMLSSERQLHLINSLLDVHTQEVQGVVLQRQPVEPSQLIQYIFQDLEPLFVKNQATFKNLIPENLPVVSADPAQLWRVFENLITNAFKHNPPGLCLIIRATLEEEKLLRFAVEDNGVGISPEACASIFELYVRASRSRRSPGLGLGLYLCRQIITAHGGEIGVVSSPGAGAKFWFTLPLFKQEFDHDLVTQEGGKKDTGTRAEKTER